MMEENDIDICGIQETRNKKMYKNRNYNVYEEKAILKKSTTYVSSGIITLTKKKYIAAKNTKLSTEYMNIIDVEPNLKIINVYMQPEKKSIIRSELINTIGKIKKIEPGREIIVLGDMNMDLHKK